MRFREIEGGESGWRFPLVMRAVGFVYRNVDVV